MPTNPSDIEKESTAYEGQRAGVEFHPSAELERNCRTKLVCRESPVDEDGMSYHEVGLRSRKGDVLPSGQAFRPPFDPKLTHVLPIASS